MKTKSHLFHYLSVSIVFVFVSVGINPQILASDASDTALIVGKWKRPETIRDGVISYETIVFNMDGTYIKSSTLKGHWKISSEKLVVTRLDTTSELDYNVSKGRLAITWPGLDSPHTYEPDAEAAQTLRQRTQKEIRELKELLAEAERHQETWRKLSEQFRGLASIFQVRGDKKNYEGAMKDHDDALKEMLAAAKRRQDIEAKLRLLEGQISR